MSGRRNPRATGLVPRLMQPGGRKLAALLLVLVSVAAACGSGDADLDGRRVIASPRATETTETTVSPPEPSERGETALPEGTPEPDQTEPPPVPEGSLAQAAISLTRIAGLSQPVAMAVRRGDGAFYVAEKGGRIRAIRNGSVADAVVLDISSQVSTGGEQGLLGLAFAPDGSRLYVNFTNSLGDTVVREYAFSGGRANTTTGRNVLEVDQPFANHNGGNLLFGPDGYLYIGLGDGGSGGDPQNNAQNPNRILGKMLRIDPTPSGANAYTVPSDNPYVGRDGLDEIWARGLRNPWRYSFDRATGDLWIGDVGQNAWEEVDFAPASDRGGSNYGWNRMEGTHTFGGRTPPPGHHAPLYEYANGSGNCAVTGGYVYRGSRIPNLRGAYVFADFCTGRLRAFVERGARATEHRFLGPRAANLASFGEDHRGELYVLSLDGAVYRIDPA